jgi:hypothetical protein
MVKFKQVILPSVLALSLLVPGAAFAHDGGKAGGKLKGHSGKPAISAPQHHKGGKGDKGGPGHKGGMSVQKQTLFTLLAEKYSADTVKDWEAVIAEGEKLRADIKSLVAANPGVKKSLKPQHSEDLKAKLEAHKAVREAFAAALKAKDADKIKSSLASILTQLKERNALMASKLAELQSATAK